MHTIINVFPTHMVESDVDCRKYAMGQIVSGTTNAEICVYVVRVQSVQRLVASSPDPPLHMWSGAMSSLNHQR